MVLTYSLLGVLSAQLVGNLAAFLTGILAALRPYHELASSSLLTLKIYKRYDAHYTELHKY